MHDQPTVIPMIAYENVAEAMDWLCRAFGFEERTRIVTGEGRLSHGELEVGDGLIMLATPSPHYRGPKRHRDTCADARKWSEVPYIVDGVHVYVADVKAHFAKAEASGATILSPVEAGNGVMRYRAEDLEGHRWMFSQR